jgi:hypothetical protein
MPECACGTIYVGSGPKCPACLFGPRVVRAPVRQAPIQPPVVGLQLPVLRATPLQPVQPPAPSVAPNTLPPGSVLEVTCARSGVLNFVTLNPANRLYVLRGTRLDFRASQAGAAANLAPLINFTTAMWGGTAGGAGAGSARSVTFDTLSLADSDLASHTVTLSFAGTTVTIRCVVYSLTGTLTPADAFAGRSLTRFGVDERVALTFATTPAGLAAATVGGLRWTVATAGRDDDGLLHDTVTNTAPPGATGLANYIAPCRTHAALAPHQATRDVRLKLVVAGGICMGVGQEVPITICKPSAHMIKAAGNERHIMGTPSAGFFGTIFFSPKNVSFQTLRWREGTGAIRTWGFGNDLEDGVTHHGVTVFGSAAHGTINAGDINNGSVVNQVIGEEKWPIYWEYTYPNLVTGVWTGDWIRLQIAHHIATLYQSGRMTMFKGHVECAEGFCTAKVSKKIGEASVP